MDRRLFRRSGVAVPLVGTATLLRAQESVPIGAGVELHGNMVNGVCYADIGTAVAVHCSLDRFPTAEGVVYCNDEYPDPAYGPNAYFGHNYVLDAASGQPKYYSNRHGSLIECAVPADDYALLLDIFGAGLLALLAIYAVKSTVYRLVTNQ